MQGQTQAEDHGQVRVTRHSHSLVVQHGALSVTLTPADSNFAVAAIPDGRLNLTIAENHSRIHNDHDYTNNFWSRAQDQGPSQANPQALAAQENVDSMQEVMDYYDVDEPEGASEALIERLTSLGIFKKSIGRDTNCAICIKDLEEGEKICWLPCFHFFHKDCAMTWLLMNKRCPLCRTEITKQSSLYNNKTPTLISNISI